MSYFLFWLVVFRDDHSPFHYQIYLALNLKAFPSMYWWLNLTTLSYCLLECGGYFACHNYGEEA